MQEEVEGCQQKLRFLQKLQKIGEIVVFVRKSLKGGEVNFSATFRVEMIKKKKLNRTVMNNLNPDSFLK